VAKAQLVADIRISRRIQPTRPDHSAEDDLGLPIRSARRRSRCRPSSGVTLTNIDIRVHTVRVTTSPRRPSRKPTACRGQVYVTSRARDDAAGGPEPVGFEGLTTTPTSISYDDADAGKTARFVAAVQPRGEAGPNSTPVVVPIAARRTPAYNGVFFQNWVQLLRARSPFHGATVSTGLLRWWWHVEDAL